MHHTAGMFLICLSCSAADLKGTRVYNNADLSRT